jgi:hypothetical protein
LKSKGQIRELTQGDVDMRNLLTNIGALGVGIGSFAITVALVLGLQRLVGFNLFSLMWWFVMPIGAFVTGLLAASGYYFGAVRLNVKPTRVVAFGMLLAAALVQVTLYYSQYMMAATEDGQPISNVVAFPRFVGWMLSHTKYGLIVSGYRPGGEDGGLEVGVLGYVVAVVQFLALVAGGLIVYLVLADKPYCAKCAKYLKHAMKLQVPFAGDMNTIADLRKTDELSTAYFQQLRQLPAGATAALELELSRCPGCRIEALAERPMILQDGKLAYQGDAYRTMWAAVGGSVEHLVASAARPGPGTVPA